MARLPSPLSRRLMPWIQDNFVQQRTYIEKRLIEGRMGDGLDLGEDDLNDEAEEEKISNQ
jgi:hypothetical protein